MSLDFEFLGQTSHNSLLIMLEGLSPCHSVLLEGERRSAITGLAAAVSCNSDTLWESDYHRE